MENNGEKLINKLAKKCLGLKSPVHIIAVCSGGKTVGKYVNKYLNSKGLKSSYYEVWTNIVDGKATMWKSDFGKKDYTGTALIVEDVIWKGTSVKAVKRMLKSFKNKKVYTAVLLDFNKKADFSIYN
jgi:hypoxanthine phosphoribosyltransferase